MEQSLSKVESINQSLSNSCQQDKLSKSNALEFAKNMHYMSLGKNIKIMDGTLKIWEDLIIEDMNKYMFELEDFFNAMKVCIRRQAYNRIDYADIYFEAISIYCKRTLDTDFKCKVCGGDFCILNDGIAHGTTCTCEKANYKEQYPSLKNISSVILERRKLSEDRR